MDFERNEKIKDREHERRLKEKERERGKQILENNIFLSNELAQQK